MSHLVSFGTPCLATGLAWWQLQGLDKALEQPSVQAALIAAGIGFAVFAGTQWILYCRERTTLLLKKLEDLYKAASSLANLSVLRLDYYAGPESHESLMKVKGVELTDEIFMLQAFYFPPLEARVNSVMELNRTAISLLAGPTRAADKREIRAALAALDESIAGTLGVIAQNQRRYTKGSWYLYIPLVRTFFP